MKRSDKKDFVQNLKEDLSNSSSVIVAHYAGLSVKEIEEILGTDVLDMEFAITTNNIVIFQVRPLTTGKELHMSNIEKNVLKILMENKKKYRVFKSKFYFVSSRRLCVSFFC